MCSPKGNIKFQRFPASGGFLCVPLRNILISLRKSRLRRVSLCSSKENIQFSKETRLRRFPLCLSLRKYLNLQKNPASGGFPFVFPYENAQHFRMPVCGGFPLCSSRGNIQMSKNCPPPTGFPLCSPKEMSAFPKTASGGFSFVF